MQPPKPCTRPLLQPLLRQLLRGSTLQIMGIRSLQNCPQLQQLGRRQQVLHSSSVKSLLEPSQLQQLLRKLLQQPPASSSSVKSLQEEPPLIRSMLQEGRRQVQRSAVQELKTHVNQQASESWRTQDQFQPAGPVHHTGAWRALALQRLRLVEA